MIRYMRVIEGQSIWDDMWAYGLDEMQMIMFFPLSLSGVAQCWYASLDVSHRRTREELTHEFLSQYAFNSDIDVFR